MSCSDVLVYAGHVVRARFAPQEKNSETWNLEFIWGGWHVCQSSLLERERRPLVWNVNKSSLRRWKRGYHSTTLQCKQMDLGWYIFFLSLGLLFNHLLFQALVPFAQKAIIKQKHGNIHGIFSLRTYKVTYNVLSKLGHFWKWKEYH